MNKHKIKKLEKIALKKEIVETPIFVFEEAVGYVIGRAFIASLGYSTQELPTPKEGGALYIAGDETLCLLPKDHESLTKEDSYLYFKGATGRSILL